MTSATQGPRQGNTANAEVTTLPAIQVRSQIAIDPPVAGDVRACASVGPAGELVAVWTQVEDLAATMSSTHSPGGVDFRDVHSPRPTNARVTVHAPEVTSVISIAGLALANFTAQPLPGGNVLLVSHRCYWRPEGADRNAVVYDTDGHVLTTEVLGDGISRVQADSDGYTWVAYSEEGIYGNYGWGSQGSPEPVGASGLVRWSPDLQPSWQFPSTSPFGFISDCSVLNVGGTTAWTSFDEDYPIVEVRADDAQLVGWRNDVGAMAALAVSGSRAALVGASGRLTVGELSFGQFQAKAEYRIVLPSGAPLPARTQIVGRGPVLHFITDDNWYQLSIRDIPAEP